MSADEFKKRVAANWGATDESLNEDVNDLTDEEFNKIHDAIEKHADYFSDIYGEAFEGLDEVTLEAAQEQADILCKEAVEDIIYEEMPEVYDRIIDIPAESMCRDLDLYDYWIYIDEDEIDEIVAAEEEREKENQPWNAADDLSLIHI